MKTDIDLLTGRILVALVRLEYKRHGLTLSDDVYLEEVLDQLQRWVEE